MSLHFSYSYLGEKENWQPKFLDVFGSSFFRMETRYLQPARGEAFPEGVPERLSRENVEALNGPLTENGGKWLIKGL